MTLDDARARVAAMLEYADAYVEDFGEYSAWTSANMDGAHVLARKAATHALNAAALRLVLDALPTREQEDGTFYCKCGARWSGRYLTQENLVRHKHYCNGLSDRAIARTLGRDTETPR